MRTQAKLHVYGVCLPADTSRPYFGLCAACRAGQERFRTLTSAYYVRFPHSPFTGVQRCEIHGASPRSLRLTWIIPPPSHAHAHTRTHHHLFPLPKCACCPFPRNILACALARRDNAACCGVETKMHRCLSACHLNDTASTNCCYSANATVHCSCIQQTKRMNTKTHLIKTNSEELMA